MPEDINPVEQEKESSFVDNFRFGDKSMLESLAIWGIVALAALGLILAIIASFTGSNSGF